MKHKFSPSGNDKFCWNSSMYLKPASASSRYVWIVTYQLVTECSVISCSSNVGKDETLMIFVPQAANVTRGEGGAGPFLFFFSAWSRFWCSRSRFMPPNWWKHHGYYIGCYATFRRLVQASEWVTVWQKHLYWRCTLPSCRLRPTCLCTLCLAV